MAEAVSSWIMKMHLSSFPMTFPFLNSVINLIYHMDNQQLNRYVGDYDKFQEVYAVKKAQLEAAYKRQQTGNRRAGRLSWPAIRPGCPPGIWPCPGRRSWIKWRSLSWQRRSQSRNSISWRPGTAGKYIFRDKGSCDRLR